MRSVTRLEPERLQPDAELRQFLRRLDGDGAVVSFVGLARAKDRDGNGVAGLHLDHYPGVTEKSLDAIVADACRRFSVSDVTVIHRCGYVAAGDPIVFVAASSPHRRVGFQAADFLMDRLKTDAAFWKREEGPSGARWIEPTAQDLEDRRRWET